ncbi:MAG: two-CW domain-containing protein [Promethearchaeota archaeon]
MHEKQNCWEFKDCGREPGGRNIKQFGVCPASTDLINSGQNEGNNSGRICWAVAGTFCGGIIQGNYNEKYLSCMNCDFFHKVRNEQGNNFSLLKPGQKYQRSTHKIKS